MFGQCLYKIKIPDSAEAVGHRFYCFQLYSGAETSRFSLITKYCCDLSSNFIYNSDRDRSQKGTNLGSKVPVTDPYSTVAFCHCVAMSPQVVDSGTWRQ